MRRSITARNWQNLGILGLGRVGDVVVRWERAASAPHVIWRRIGKPDILSSL